MRRGDPAWVDHVGNVWYVYEDGFLQASKVNYGEYAQVYDVTGCTAAFFFDTTGRASVAHLRAGAETVQATEAAQQARDAGTTDSVTVYSPSLVTAEEIGVAIRAVLGQHVTVVPQKYKLKALERGESWQFTHQSGDTTKSVKAEKSRC